VTPTSNTALAKSVTFTAVEPKPAEELNINGIAMRYIEPGSFYMGCEDSDLADSRLGVADCTSAARPKHPVTLEKGFYLGKYEVTQAQWDEVMNHDHDPLYVNPANFKEYPAGTRNVNLPQENITWMNVQEFIKALNGGKEYAEALTENGKAWRLPYEVEWEYAARGGTTYNKFAGLTTPDLPDSVAWYNGNSGSTTHPAGDDKLPNEFGLYNMSGNVREWVTDFSCTSYDGWESWDPLKGPPQGLCVNRNGLDLYVMRGGSYIDAYTSLPVWVRSGALGTTAKAISIGFRLALDVAPPAK
jgi:formylglycine-generating enzyme required for sulfatase activity